MTDFTWKGYWKEWRDAYPEPKKDETLSNLLSASKDSKEKALHIIACFFETIKKLVTYLYKDMITNIRPQNDKDILRSLLDEAMTEVWLVVYDGIDEWTKYSKEEENLKEKLKDRISTRIFNLNKDYYPNQTSSINSIEYEISSSDKQPDEVLEEKDIKEIKQQINVILDKRLTPIEKEIRNLRISSKLSWLEIVEELNLEMGTILYFYSKAERFSRAVHGTLTDNSQRSKVYYTKAK